MSFHAIKTSRDHRRRLLAVTPDWWDPDNENLSPWAAYAPKGAADLAASYTDLTGNNHDAGVGAAPAWDAVSGWKLDGNTHYLTTTFVPQNDQTQSLLVRFSNGAGRIYLAGVYDGNGKAFLLQPRNSANTSLYYHNGAFTGTAPTMTAGNMAVAGNQGYRNGAAEAGSINAWSASTALALYIGAINNAGSDDWHSEVYIQALAIYDTALTATQVAAIVAAMAAL